MVSRKKGPIKFIDLFCGIGGFHFGAQNAANKLELEEVCVFASDIDEAVQRAYEANFNFKPAGDITEVEAHSIPDHDVLFAGFPCQPFSIIGDKKGFDDTRGTLFFDIARILAAKQPTAFILENVKMLTTHDKGRTFAKIQATLDELGYHHQTRVLNAMDFGLPQKRERTFIVGFKAPTPFEWPNESIPMRPLEEILEVDVPDFYFASEKIQKSRKERIKKPLPTNRTIWHENRSGNVSANNFSCALRAGASYSYLLVDGVRRPTEREMLRLQGFPESFKLVTNYSETRKQAGNSVPVPMVGSVIEQVFKSLVSQNSTQASSRQRTGQLVLT